MPLIVVPTLPGIRRPAVRRRRLGRHGAANTGGRWTWSYMAVKASITREGIDYKAQACAIEDGSCVAGGRHRGPGGLDRLPFPENDTDDPSQLQEDAGGWGAGY